MSWWTAHNATRSPTRGAWGPAEGTVRENPHPCAARGAYGEPVAASTTTARLREQRVLPRSLDALRLHAPEDQLDRLHGEAAWVREHLTGRVVWNISSTPRGGGVAEMLRPLVAYTRGAGIDCRWLVIAGSPDFFTITKRLHHALHGSGGDGGPLASAERAVYEEVLAGNLVELEAVVRAGDVVILHDPQTAGLAPGLARLGARVVWRCHIGSETAGARTDAGWAFLERYVTAAELTIFTLREFVPPGCTGRPHRIIRPSIDPPAPKNQELAGGAVRAILVRAGIVEGPPGPAAATYRRSDGSPGRVDRAADIVRLGRAPAMEAPMVLQVSRWDPLKDHAGVMAAFARLPGDTLGNAHLVLAGPSVTSVDDDPEAPEVIAEVLRRWRQLPHDQRRRLQLVQLPMRDVDENGAMVNALQRHATIVVQKSIEEGFGLTAAEAMWKARPVVASPVGGLREQIVDGESGILLSGPRDESGLADALERLLNAPQERRRIGAVAHERVAREFLSARHLLDYAALLRDLASELPGPAARRVRAAEL